MWLQDTGISVRKRVIKILRDICLEQPAFSKITEMCVRMIRRVNDEEGIKVWISAISTYISLSRHWVVFFPCVFIEHLKQIKTLVLTDEFCFLCRNWLMRHSRSCGSLQLLPTTKKPWPERSSTLLMWSVQKKKEKNCFVLMSASALLLTLNLVFVFGSPRRWQPAETLATTGSSNFCKMWADDHVF